MALGLGILSHWVRVLPALGVASGKAAFRLLNLIAKAPIYLSSPPARTTKGSLLGAIFSLSAHVSSPDRRQH